MTAQIHECLRLDGKLCRMACELSLPESAVGLVFRSGKKRRRPPSNCWRGYVGFWEIANDKLYLRKIVGNIRGRFRPPLFADWFSGIIRIPQGEILTPVHDEFYSIFERDHFLEMECGVVKRRWHEDHGDEMPYYQPTRDGASAHQSH